MGVAIQTTHTPRCDQMRALVSEASQKAMSVERENGYVAAQAMYRLAADALLEWERMCHSECLLTATVTTDDR